MKMKAAYFRVDGKLLFGMMQHYPGTTNTLPKDAKYLGIIHNPDWPHGQIGMLVASDTLPEVDVAKADQLPEMEEMPTWTKL